MADYIAPQDYFNAIGQAATQGEHDKRDPRMYGGYAGGATDDMGRYRGMGAAPVYATGPAIDQARSNQVRGMQLGSLQDIERRAGGMTTQAQMLQQQQTQGAMHGAMSNAASIKGGAMARAAAARGAQNQVAQIQAQGNQDQMALRAREMADAAGIYGKATADLRGQDLGVANSQAGLNVGQAAQNDQREKFYEDMRFDVGQAATNAGLGKGAQDSAATTANIRANQQADADARETGMKYGSTVVGGVMGGIQAAEKTKEPRYGY